MSSVLLLTLFQICSFVFVCDIYTGLEQSETEKIMTEFLCLAELFLEHRQTFLNKHSQNDSITTYITTTLRSHRQRLPHTDKQI